ncbi:MAG: TetR/AcrR family transcriptional regulator [Alcanivoracaceae bacterium]|jgi:AcrR family transcriptional regulator|nr:TetR/AcrR family transcriptional regulator [Alcanivoracaceae bacterium]
MIQLSAAPSDASPNRKPRGQTRQRLLDAGMTLFANKGLEGVTVSELEEAVGLKAGSGSFYRHFSDKDALLEAIIEREIERAQSRRSLEQDALYDPTTEIHQALEQQFRLTLIGLRQNAALISLLSRAADHFPALIKRLRDAFVRQATQTVAKSYSGRIQRGELIDADPHALAMLVQSTLFGYFSAEAAFGRPADAEATEQALIKTLVSMMIR